MLHLCILSCALPVNGFNAPAAGMGEPVLTPTYGSDLDGDRKEENVTQLVILALLDLSGPSLLQTAQAALARVNAQKLIPGFSLQLLVNDSKCDRGAGVDAFFHAIYTTKQRSLKPFIMLLGPHCSHVTESVASITSYWNIVQISHAATSAGLNDRQKFPYFFRMATAEATHNAARLHFLRRFRWDAVSVLVQSKDEYTLVINY